MPEEVIFDSTHKIEYLYNAAGEKVHKYVQHLNEHKIIDYLDGFQYAGNVLQFFPNSEGYVDVTTFDNEAQYFNYVYNYTDHLGNIRVSYTIDPQTDKLKILDENHYYPFGLRHENYLPLERWKFIQDEIEKEKTRLVRTRVDDYKYKYQGQELQDELGLNWYSFKWRNYMPDVGRFFNHDPLSEKYTYNSPYAFQENKMGMGREFEGLELVLTHGTWAARGDKELYSMSKADYKGGSTWQKGFSQSIATATGWNASTTYEFTWTGNNNSSDRSTAGQKLASNLMSDNNPNKADKHATLVGHSHGGNVNKEAKNILEADGWTVDIINIATPQRTDHQTNETGEGEYLNFYNDNDIVQYIGAKPKTASEGSRIDSNAEVNQEIETSNNWFKSSGGHSFHQDPKAQEQMIETIKKHFK